MWAVTNTWSASSSAPFSPAWASPPSSRPHWASGELPSPYPHRDTHTHSGPHSRRRWSLSEDSWNKKSCYLPLLLLLPGQTYSQAAKVLLLAPGAPQGRAVCDFKRMCPSHAFPSLSPTCGNQDHLLPCFPASRACASLSNDLFSQGLLSPVYTAP